MLKKLVALPLLAVLLLTGCSGLSESERQERADFKKWSSDVYGEKKFDYNEGIKLEKVADKYLKPTIDVIASSAPEGRAGVNLEMFKEDNWFKNLCNNYVDVTGELIAAPLASPVVGDSSSIVFAGYMNEKQLTKVAKKLKTDLVVTPGDAFILEGSSVNYPYDVNKYSATVENEYFKVNITGDTAWNALAWEEYYTVDDPGLFSQKNHALPTDEYMPVAITVYYKPACVVKQ